MKRDECYVSYKQLTDADMGRSIKSHQTHIGLFENSFPFLANNDEIQGCFFLYGGEVSQHTLLYGRMRKDIDKDEWRSPKIRQGSGDADTIVNAIRNSAKQILLTDRIYLFWWTFPSGQLAFWMVADDTTEFNEIQKLGLLKLTKGQFPVDSDEYVILMNYLEEHYSAAFVGEDVIDPLPILTPPEIIGTEDSEPPYGKVVKYLSYEDALTHYFETLESQNKIQNFQFYEGKSYELTYVNSDGNTVFCFVTDTYGEEPDEIKVNDSMLVTFKMNQQHLFNIFAVRETEEGDYDLRICTSPQDELSRIDKAMMDVEKILDGSMNKFEISIDINKLAFSRCIRL